MSANLNLSDDAINQSTGIARVGIGGETLDVYCKYKDSSLTLVKSTITDEIADSNLYRQFSVTIKSVDGNNSDVVITDELPGGASFIALSSETGATHQPTLTVDSTSTELNSENFKIDDTKLKVNVGSLDRDKEATLTYWISYPVSSASDFTNKDNKALATYTNNNSTTNQKSNEDKASLAMASPSISKSATLSSIQPQSGRNVDWTIVITGCSYNEGYVIKDSEVLTSGTTDKTSNLTTKGEVSLSRTKKGAESSDKTWKISYDNLLAGKVTLKNSYDGESATSETAADSLNIGLADGDTLTITYTNTYKTDDIETNVGLQSVNTVKLTNNNLGLTEENTTIKAVATYHVVPGEYIVTTKKYGSFDVTTNKITWIVEINIPKDNFSDYTYFDIPSSNQTIDLNDITVEPSGASVTKEEYTDASNNKGFKLSSFSGGTETTYKINKDGKDYEFNVYKYTITYKTTLDQKSTSVIPKNTDNKYYFKYKYKTGDEQTSGEQTESPDMSLVLKKWGQSDGNTTGTQTWYIEVNLETFDASSSDKKFNITDTLPSNMTLVDNSFTITDNKESIDVDATINKNIFTADLTDVLKTYKTNHTSEKSVNIYYQTKFIDLKTAANATSTSYKNVVKSTYGTDNDYVSDEDDADIDAKFNPSEVISKDYSYTSKDNSQVAYTITINPSGISLAKDGESTYEITDTLGSKLSYVHDDDTGAVATVLATVNGSKVDITNECTISVDDEKNVMVISGIRDKAPITIEYNCYINLMAGTDTSTLTEKEVGNSIEFNGIDGIDFSSSSTFNKVVNDATKNSTVPINAVLRITKVDADNKEKVLEGAEFRIYPVKLENGEFVEFEDSEAIGDLTAKTITSNSNGVAKVSLTRDYIWCLEETKSPEGYRDSNYKVYVLFDGNNYMNNENIDDSVPNDVTFIHKYNGAASLSLTVKNEAESTKPEDPTTPTDPKTNEDTGGGNTGHVLTCEEYMKSKDWTWSEKTKTCVYRVRNTSTKDDD